MGLFPLTRAIYIKLVVVDRILARSSTDIDVRRTQDTGNVERICFFDGGSRGNPGPGGSIIVEYEKATGTTRPIWAAATSLGNKTTTNNVAEFVGIQRVLARVVEMKWSRVHVVGDSAMILRMLGSRRAPKAQKLQHWYRVTRRLADMCEVMSWTHHLRRYNKAADWVANYAMDNKKSVIWSDAEESGAKDFWEALEQRLRDDVGHWSMRDEGIREERTAEKE